MRPKEIKQVYLAEHKYKKTEPFITYIKRSSNPNEDCMIRFQMLNTVECDLRTNVSGLCSIDVKTPNIILNVM